MKRHYSQKINVLEMHIFRWMYSNTKIDQVRNEDIFAKLRIAPLKRRA